MKDITQTFGALYHPVKAFVVYQEKTRNKILGNNYVAAYDMDANGYPINAHPLAIAESIALAKALDVSQELKRSFLKPKGLLPENILYINPDHNGYVIWHTPMMQTELYFVNGLDIPNGKATVPPLLWKASKGSLNVYALYNDSKPAIETSLYHAPFFNLHEDGNVCMGTVAVNITSNCMLEDFMEHWQQYFFNSYFSHLIHKKPVKGNIVQLWQSLVGSRKKFPLKSLIKTKLTIKNLLK